MFGLYKKFCYRICSDAENNPFNIFYAIIRFWQECRLYTVIYQASVTGLKLSEKCNFDIILVKRTKFELLLIDHNGPRNI